jgi:hypothetical protein
MHKCFEKNDDLQCDDGWMDGWMREQVVNESRKEIRKMPNAMQGGMLTMMIDDSARKKGTKSMQMQNQRRRVASSESVDEK